MIFGFASGLHRKRNSVKYSREIQDRGNRKKPTVAGVRFAISAIVRAEKSLGRVAIAGESVVKRFSSEFLRAFDSTKYLYIRAGEHRFIPIWVVVVGDRVLVRSWNDKASGWYRALLAAKRGAVRLGEREVQIRAVPPRSQRLIDAADDAYAAKYTTKSNLKYVEGFRTVKRKARTLELLPASYD